MTGLIPNLPMRDYLAAPGLGHSTLEHIRPTPAHLRAFLDAPPEEVKAEHFLLGTLIHQTILEPESPWPQISVKPEGMKFSTNEGKAWKAARQAARAVIMTGTDYECLLGCVRSAAHHEYVQRVMARGQAEVSGFTTFQVRDLDLPVKARFDWVPSGNALMDIKTVRDATPDGFRRAALEFGWFRKADWYLRVWNQLCEDDQIKGAFLFIAIEKCPPYAVALYEVEAPAMGRAEQQNDAHLIDYAEAITTGVWRGYPGEPVLLSDRWERRES